jgi:peptidoglycan hydrolase CwlO-like protein|tara:strand:+ start:505 stop:717 length:213 start_codon:yes stop_codon:yes gene_type:complete
MKVKGHESLIRDENSNAILNTNLSEYDQYLSIRSKRKKGTDRIDNMENDLKSLKDDINEIKTLLKELSNG